MSLFDPGATIILGFSLWLTLFPRQAVRLYCWFGGHAGADQRRLDALTPNAFRLSGVLFLTLVLIILVLGSR